LFAIVVAALVASGGAAAQSTPGKKAIVQRILALQQSEIESFARGLVERPAAQMMREAGLAMQAKQLSPEKREAEGKAIEAEVKKYVDEAYPIAKERAVKIAPSTIGATLEAKMTEDELKALLAWLESPTNKKYQQVAIEVRNNFAEKMVGEMRPVLDPKLQALDGRIRTILGVAPAGSAGSGARPAPPPARPASK
jgi:hypothetical protein